MGNPENVKSGGKPWGKGSVSEKKRITCLQALALFFKGAQTANRLSVFFCLRPIIKLVKSLSRKSCISYKGPL